MALGRELPEDLVADVLRRLPPRSLAVSRCVCRAWRDLVDARRLLRADLLPRSVGGIFANFSTLYSPEFFVRPTTRRPSISGDFEFIPGFSRVEDHCNGLVLCTGTTSGHDYVSNPATRRWARLPLPPQSSSQIREKAFHRIQIKCLAYDPTLSPHYHVVLIHSVHQVWRKSELKPHQMMKQWEGHVSSFPLQAYVYSSETGCWEERFFAPEGHVVETTTNDKKVYWRGAIYILCQDRFVMRISISNAKYILIPTPLSDVEFGYDDGYFSLGRSEKGVYCTFRYGQHKLQILLLNESSVQMLWELRHSVDLTTFARKLCARDENNIDQQKGPWILQDINYFKYPYGNDKQREAQEDNFEWNSDDDNVIDTENMVEGDYGAYIGLLGFHPYKEIVFLHADMARVVAYHWNTSQFQDLGYIWPEDYYGHETGMDSSFIYTPCWMEDFPEK